MKETGVKLPLVVRLEGKRPSGQTEARGIRFDHRQRHHDGGCGAKSRGGRQVVLNFRNASESGAPTTRVERHQFGCAMTPDNTAHCSLLLSRRCPIIWDAPHRHILEARSPEIFSRGTVFPSEN
jgi:hypothetical protein